MAKMSRCSPEIPNMVSRIYRAPRGVSIQLRAGLLLWLCASGLGAGGFGASWTLADELKPRGLNAYQMVTGTDSEEDRTHWDQFFNTKGYVYGTEPAVFLRENVGLLPVGRALDIAMAEGRNGVFLAKKGFQVDGVDYSEVALRKAKRLAKTHHVSITTINADLNHYVIKPESYDVIVNINFLLRPLIPQIKRGLKKGGFVVFENYTLDQLKNPGAQGLLRDYLLSRGELREFFKDFQVIVYRETNDGKSAVASLIARKP
jgi:tellurite methyltransferase